MPTHQVNSTAEELNTFTVFCHQANGLGTIWISTVDIAPGNDEEAKLEAIRGLAVKKCASEWYGADAYHDATLHEGIVCMGIAEGDVAIIDWDDTHIEQG